MNQATFALQQLIGLTTSSKTAVAVFNFLTIVNGETVLIPEGWGGGSKTGQTRGLRATPLR